MIRLLQKSCYNYWLDSNTRSYLWANAEIKAAKPTRLLDVGCGDGDTWLTRGLTEKPAEFYGVEGDPLFAKKAEAKGIKVATFDLNGTWPYADNFFDAVHSTQVVEHVHNTRGFFAEIYRVLKPGGLLVVTSENLCSFLNLFSMALGYTPFSLMNVCGWYLGNPLGLHAEEEFSEHSGRELVAINDPKFSGIAGHNRVLSVAQAQALLEKIGFQRVEARSLGLMPLPRFLGAPCEKLMWRRGHWLTVKAYKGL